MRPHSATIGPPDMTQPQVLEEREASSLATQESFPPHLGMSCVDNLHYRPVQKKRGVADSQDGEEVLEPASKRARGEQSALPQGAPKTSSPLWAEERLPVLDTSLDSRALRGTEKVGSRGESPAQEEGSRAETPEGLVGLDSGFSS